MTRTERTYYAVFGLYNVSWSFLGPMYAWFLLDRGLDLFEINLVLAVYLITAFLFEVPTGAVADVFGRKVSFIASCVVRSFAFALYAFCDELHEFLFAEFIDAIGTTLASGALDAWAVDGMREEGDDTPKDRFFARSLVLARAMMIASGIAGGYLAAVDLVLPWFGGAAGFALTAVAAAVLMRETRGESAAPEHRAGLRDTVRGGFGAVRGAPVLGFLCVVTLATSFAFLSAQQLWPPRLMELGGGEVWLLGWVWALLNVSSLVGSILVPRLLAHASRAVVLALASAWRAATLGMAAQAATFSPATAGYLLQEMGFGVGEPLLSSWMNEHTDSRNRATVLSIRSMAFTLGGSLGLVCLGIVARAAGIPTAWAMAAVVHALVAIGVVLVGRALAGGRAPASGRAETGTAGPAAAPSADVS
jgi:MFS family permease